MASKTIITWLFNNILCYLSFLVLAKKIFQQTVVRVYYTLNQSYIDLCAQSVNVTEYLFREHYSLTPSGLQNRLHVAFIDIHRCPKSKPQVKCH